MSTAFLFGVGCMLATAAAGHSLDERIGAYGDNQGLSRQRQNFGLALEPKMSSGVLTDGSFRVDYTRDTFQNSQMGDNEYEQTVYGTGYRVSNTLAVSMAQTWSKLTETRQVSTHTSDGQVRSFTNGVGVSRWVWHESLRLSLDLSRTVVDQPYYPTLDYDSVTVGAPELTTSSGAVFGVRHLATPTTIVDYTYGQVQMSNRPQAHVGAVAIRQFVPAADGAVHYTVTRAINRGRLTTESSYGQVDAWTQDLALLKNLWRGALARLGYRRYVEDETTRAYEDRVRLGTDTVTAGLSQEVPKDFIEKGSVPLTLDLAVARYATNTAVRAQVIEAGIGAKF